MNDTTNISGLSRFSLSFDAASSVQSKSLYANGNMQIRVLVTLVGKDQRGKPIPLPAAIYNNVRLINYRTGKVLDGKWKVREQTNDLWRKISGEGANELPEEGVDPNITVREFWVSSTLADTVHVGAVVLLNDRLIRTNNTTVGDKHDSSLTLVAEAPVTYAIDEFKFERILTKGQRDQDLFHCYLGLYPGGRQLKLVDWSAADDGHHYRHSRTVFEGFGGVVDSDWRWYVNCKFAGVNDDHVYFTLAPPQDSRGQEAYNLRVNDRDGELSVIYGVSSSFTSDNYARKDVFDFIVYDTFGTAHKLRFRPDFEVRLANFVLERG